jgi:hypothetical protein
MSLIGEKIKCCGAGFEGDTISLVGIYTLAIPALVLLLPLLMITFSIALVSPSRISAHNLLKDVFFANLRAIEKSELAPRLKCHIVGILFPYYPRISGIFFRFFNLFLVSGSIAITGIFVLLLRTL